LCVALYNYYWPAESWGKAGQLAQPLYIDFGWARAGMCRRGAELAGDAVFHRMGQRCGGALDNVRAPGARAKRLRNPAGRRNGEEHEAARAGCGERA
jgi:hypothetical protein